MNGGGGRKVTAKERTVVSEPVRRNMLDKTRTPARLEQSIDSNIA